MTKGYVASKKRLAKNTFLLYVRMAFSLIVSLYTSRVILQTLGVEDYGIYSVVGGIVVMFKFLNSSMSGATSRFLAFELGKGYSESLKKAFSSAVLAHILIAFIIFFISETIGLWILVYKLNIPENRMFAAHVVYQCSVLSMILKVIQVPYNALIIAHEKFDVYAYVEILHVVLNLGLVFLLVIGNFDKLILYSILVLLLSSFIMLIYRVYCSRSFDESHYVKVEEYSIFKKLLAFSGWDLYGNMSVAVRQQGTNILVNMYLGVAMNAACGIASSVYSHVAAFCNNVITASRPTIVKLYAQSDINGMVSVMSDAAKFSSALFFMIAFPLMMEMDYVLQLWLVSVPYKAVEICRLSLVSHIFMLHNYLMVIGIHATGKIKRISLLTGSVYLLNIVPIYVLLFCGFAIEYVYCSMIVFSILILLSNLYVLKKQIPTFPIYYYAVNSIIKGLLVSLPALLIMFCIEMIMSSSIIRLILQLFFSVSMISIMFYLFVLNKTERSKIKSLISKRIKVSL